MGARSSTWNHPITIYQLSSGTFRENMVKPTRWYVARSRFACFGPGTPGLGACNLDKQKWMPLSSLCPDSLCWESRVCTEFPGIAWRHPIIELGSVWPYRDFLGSKKHSPFASGWLRPEQGWGSYCLGVGLGCLRSVTDQSCFLTPAALSLPPPCSALQTPWVASNLLLQ